MNKESLIADWQCTADIPQGTETGVHVWKLPLLTGNFLEQYLGLLDDKEQNHYRNLPEGLQKQVFASHRLGRRLLLSRYTGIAANKLHFGASLTGKPFLQEPDIGLNFNSSHSSEQILFAVSGSSEVGIDVEKIRLVRDWQKIAERVFPKPMLEVLAGDPLAEENFMQYWTRFEAIQKCHGLGIFGKQSTPEGAGDLRLWSFKCSEHYQATLAALVEDTLPEIRFLIPDTDSLLDQN
jgi:phosphopantetheinyl transferase